MIYCNQPFRILSDGKVLYVIMDNDAYKITEPCLRSFNLKNNFLELTEIGGYREYIIKQPGFDLDLGLSGYSGELIKTKDILLDFFESASIRDLLKEIDKKIEKQR